MNEQTQGTKLATVAGSYRDAAAINKRLDWAKNATNLVTPATAIGQLPEGCAIALNVVSVDVELDTYNVAGKRGLSKTVLQKIGAALGVSWDPRASGRLDDGSDPHYCRWRAVGVYRAFDGQLQTIVAEKELDLRNGSPTVEGLHEQQKAKGKSADQQVREMRMHIQSHAETKAQLRAIRSLGLKTAYTAAELAKPFVAARVMFTGQSDDPELRKLFATKTADAFLGGTRALYGGGSADATTVEPERVRLSPPPPVGAVKPDEDDAGFEGEVVDEPRPRQPQQQQRAAQPRTQSGESGYVIPGGKSKGTPIENAETKDIEYWSSRFAEDIDNGKSRDVAADKERLDAFYAEIAKREGGSQVAEGEY